MQHLTGCTKRYNRKAAESKSQADGKKMCIDLDTMPGVHDRNQRDFGNNNKTKKQKEKKEKKTTSTIKKEEKKSNNQVATKKTPCTTSINL